MGRLVQMLSQDNVICQVSRCELGEYICYLELTTWGPGEEITSGLYIHPMWVSNQLGSSFSLAGGGYIFYIRIKVSNGGSFGVVKL
jgi:hypothetical protein